MFRSILLATLVCGVLDILSACIYTMIAGHTPLQMLTGLGGAVLGDNATGVAAAAVGISLHFAIMFVMCAVYFLVVVKLLPFALKKPIVVGAAYGIVLWAVMNLIVLPLRWPGLFPKFTPRGFSEAMFSHVVLVGIPMAIIASRAFKAPQPTTHTVP